MNVLSMNAGHLFLTGATLLAIIYFKKKNWLKASAALIAGALWAIYYKPALRRLDSFGIDSLVETHKFELSEALFYASTLAADLKPEPHLGRLLGPIFAGVAIYHIIHFLKNKASLSDSIAYRAKYALSFAFIATSTYSLTSGAVTQFLTSSNFYITTKENFTNPPPAAQRTESAPLLVVYIGESTSAMNMEIYGYNRDTTPKLRQLLESDEGALLFDKVFSTHTHTNSSLLEALSLPLGENQKIAPINEQKRVSIADTIGATGLKTHLISNQGQWGRDNQASSIIFSSSESRFSIETDSGGSDGAKSRPADHSFFDEHLPEKIDNLTKSGGGAIFLHSYAGHGAYLDNIPAEFRHPVDDSLRKLSSEAVFGDNLKPLSPSLVDAYDSAVRYVDYSVERVIAELSGRSSPMIFIYFSDHGDSVFTNRGHDSSRFVHEMARVPFLIYFNQAARSKYPALFDKYRSLSTTGAIATLGQLPATILDLLGIRMSPQNNQTQLPIGTPTDNRIPPIVVRRVGDGLRGVSLTDLNQPSDNAPVFDDTDSATSVFAATNLHDRGASVICYHRSNTLGKALRGSLTAQCLETDVVITEDGALSVNHPPKASVGFYFDQVAEIAKRRKLSLWIDAKNIDNPDNCEILSRTLEDALLTRETTTVEFPPNTDFNDEQLRNCAQRLRQNKIRTSYYVPTDTLKECSKSLRDDAQFSTSAPCTALDKKLADAYLSQLFSNISFDYSGLAAIEASTSGRKLRWNTWNIRPHEYPSIAHEKFDMIILKIDDPNNR